MNSQAISARIPDWFSGQPTHSLDNTDKPPWWLNKMKSNFIIKISRDKSFLMTSLQGKRQEYEELLANAGVTHANLKDYFATHARASSLDRNSDEFKTLKNHLKSLDPQRIISSEIDRYYRIYSRAETLKREIEDYEVTLTGNYFQEL